MSSPKTKLKCALCRNLFATLYNMFRFAAFLKISDFLCLSTQIYFLFYGDAANAIYRQKCHFDKIFNKVSKWFCCITLRKNGQTSIDFINIYEIIKVHWASQYKRTPRLFINH